MRRTSGEGSPRSGDASAASPSGAPPGGAKQLADAAARHVNQQVQVWSKSSGGWLDAVVVDCEMGTMKLIVEYVIPGLGKAQKRLLPSSVNLRLPPTPRGESPVQKPVGESVAATGWPESRSRSDEGDEEEADEEAEEGQDRRPRQPQARDSPQPLPQPQPQPKPQEAARPRPSAEPAAGAEPPVEAAKRQAPRDSTPRVVQHEQAPRDSTPRVVHHEQAPRDSTPQVVHHEQEAPPGELPEGCEVGRGRFRLHHQIGYGSFSTVRLARELATNEELALKLEPVEAQYPQLLDEARRYRLFAGGPGIPAVYWCGTDCGYNIMAMELLGPSLEVMFERCGRMFSLETVAKLADQMLESIEYIHNKDYIHRDLKPNNFCLGHCPEKRTRVHCLDFGLAKRFRSAASGGAGPRRHIGYRKGLPFIGTVRYASVGAQLGEEQSRRDDLQALGYVFLYLLYGSLPWQGVQATTKAERRQQILEMKLSISNQQLCEGAPQQLEEYLDYCQDLDFEADPDYAHVRGLLQAARGPSQRHGGPIGGLSELIDLASAASEG